MVVARSNGSRTVAETVLPFVSQILRCAFAPSRRGSHLHKAGFEFGGREGALPRQTYVPVRSVPDVDTNGEISVHVADRRWWSRLHNEPVRPLPSSHYYRQTAAAAAAGSAADAITTRVTCADPYELPTTEKILA